MQTWFIIQLLLIGLICGVSMYKKDNNIKTKKTEPMPLLYWAILCLLLPVVSMWCLFMDTIEEL